MTDYNREALLKVLQDVSPAIAKSELVRERTHLWFSGGFVYAFDGGLGIRVPMPAAPAWECGVSGRVLLNLLRTSGQDKVFLDLDGMDLVLQMGKSKVRLASLDAGRRPWSFPDKIKGGEVLELTPELMEAFKKASLVRTANPDYTIQYGVVLISEAGETLLIATDKRSLVQVTVQQDSKLKNPVLLPWLFVKAIRDLVTVPAKLHIMSDCLMVESNGVQICSSKLNYPEDADLLGTVESHLPDDDVFVPLPVGLKPVLDRAAILGGEADLDIAVSGKAISLSGKWVVGSITEKLVLEQETIKGSGHFTASYINRGLELATSFYLGSRSLVLTDDDGSFLYVVGVKAKDTAVGEVESEPEPEPESKLEPEETKKRTRRRRSA